MASLPEIASEPAYAGAAYESGARTQAVPGLTRRLVAVRLKTGHAVLLARGVDVLCLFLAGPGVSFVLPRWGSGLPPGSLTLASLVAVLPVLAWIGQAGGYGLDSLRSPLRHAVTIQSAAILAAAVSMLCLLAMHDTTLAQWRPAGLWLLSASLLFWTGRCGVAFGVGRAIDAGWLSRRVAVIGAGALGEEFLRRLAGTTAQPLGMFHDGPDRAATPGTPGGGLDDLVALCGQNPPDLVVIAPPCGDLGRIQKTCLDLPGASADLYLLPDPELPHTSDSRCLRLGGFCLVPLSLKPLTDEQFLIKDVFDRVLGLALLAVFSLPMLLIAAAIRLDTPGPVLFVQPRIGHQNRSFGCFKFRTMHHGMRDLLADRQTTARDVRVTRVGRLLRKLSLDELPQLLNVLAGDMSLVGPRPHAPNTRAGEFLFKDVVPGYGLRHRVKPGMTGWAQVNGWRGETRTIEQIRKRVEYDRHYIENWSLLLDIRILVLTLREVVRGKAF